MSRAPFQVLVVPWRRRDTSIEVAVLQRADYDVWQFVSGGGEANEAPLDAAKREGLEEAGITSTSYLALDSMAMIPACWFRAWPTWPSTTLVIPEFAFAIEVEDVRTSDEHIDVRWCSRSDAMALLRFDSNRTALWELHERLFPGERTKRTAFR